jgi:hypothetical protein
MFMEKLPQLGLDPSIFNMDNDEGLFKFLFSFLEDI